MPNIKSAIKRVKVTEKKNLRNRMIKSAMKTQIKKFDTAVSANEADVKLLSATQGAVDKAAAKGVRSPRSIQSATTVNTSMHIPITK